MKRIKFTSFLASCPFGEIFEYPKDLIFFSDNSGQQLPYVLVQYLFKRPEHEIKRIFPRGNAKLKSSYKRLFPSIRDKLKRSITNKEKMAKEVLDDVYVSTGGPFIK